MGGAPRVPGDAPQAMESPASYTPSDPRLRRSLERTIESEVLPRLLLAHRAGPLPPSLLAAVTRELGEADVDAFVKLLLRDDDDAVAQFVASLVGEGVAVETLYLDLLAPSARVIGDLWYDDRCDFMDTTLALGRLQRALRELGTRTAAPVVASVGAGHILLASVPGEQHTLGLFMVAEFFLRDGWSVSAGPPLTESDLLHTVQDNWFDVIGLSVGFSDRLGALRQQIARVKRASRNPDLLILVGGTAFTEDPGLVGRLGADSWAADARQAPGVARGMLAWRQHAQAQQSHPRGIAAAGGDGGGDR